MSDRHDDLAPLDHLVEQWRARARALEEESWLPEYLQGKVWRDRQCAVELEDVLAAMRGGEEGR